MFGDAVLAGRGNSLLLGSTSITDTSPELYKPVHYDRKSSHVTFGLHFIQLSTLKSTLEVLYQAAIWHIISFLT